MKYPSPQSVLYELASRGPSAGRLEALRLMGLPDSPRTWGSCPRRSRRALLRRLACDRRKSVKVRLSALKEILWNLTVDQQDALERLRKENR